MKGALLIKINKEENIKKYLKDNSYWYKYLNRNVKYYDDFYKAYKQNSRKEKVDKAGNALDTLDTVNSILKILK